MAPSSAAEEVYDGTRILVSTVTLLLVPLTLTPTLTPTFSLIRRVLQLLEAQSGSREPLRPEHPTTAYVGGGGSTPARSSAGSSTGSEVGSSVGASGRRRRSRSTATPAIATLAATALAASLGSPKASVAADAVADGGVASFAT